MTCIINPSEYDGECGMSEERNACNGDLCGFGLKLNSSIETCVKRTCPPLKRPSVVAELSRTSRSWRRRTCRSTCKSTSGRFTVLMESKNFCRRSENFIQKKKKKSVRPVHSEIRTWDAITTES